MGRELLRGGSVMSWMRELLSDNRTKALSSVRVVMFFSGMSLCFSTLLLTMIVYWRPEVVPVLTTFGPSLAGMSGVGYAAQKWATQHEKKEQ